MIKRKVLQIKDSFYIALPRQLCNLIGIRKGSILSIKFEQNEILSTSIPVARQIPDADTPSNEPEVA